MVAVANYRLVGSAVEARGGPPGHGLAEPPVWVPGEDFVLLPALARAVEVLVAGDALLREGEGRRGCWELNNQARRTRVRN